MTNLRDLIEPEILRQIQDVADVTVTENHRLGLTHNRFDVAIKLYYLEGLNASRCSAFREACYKRHIQAFSGRYAEPNNPAKNSYGQFKKVFDNLFLDIDESGFNVAQSLIPLASDGSILNGAHRTAAAIYFGKSVGTVQTNLPPPDYGYRFFRQRGVPEVMLDAAAQTFLAYDEHCFLAAVWPAAKGYDNEISAILSRVVYKKSVSLAYNGAHNLLSETYRNEPWLGTREENFPGIRNKLAECFPHFGPVRIYLFKADSAEQVAALKLRVRDLFGISNHSIHVTNDQEEAVRLGNLLLNDNGVHFLNHGKPHKIPDGVLPRVTMQRTPAPGEIDNVFPNANLTMAAYGFRRGATPKSPPDGPAGTGIDSAPGTINEFYAESLIELADNPRHHFVYRETKFVSLKQVYHMKVARHGEKDIADARMIASIVTDNMLKEKLNSVISAARLYRLILSVKLRRLVVKSLARLGLLNTVKNLVR